MESVYKPENYQSSKPINFKEYFDRCCNSLVVENMINLDEDHLNKVVFNKLNIAYGNIKKQIVEEFSVESFKEQDPRFNCGFNFSDTQLDKIKTRLGKAALDIVTSEYEKEKQIETTEQHVEPPASSGGSENDIKPGHDFLITIRVYTPFRSSYTVSHMSRSVHEQLRLSHELVVLGSNLLSEFRDKILCTRDHGPWEEYDHLNLENLTDAKEKYPSGFLFIQDVFYNDTRNEKAIDYSEPIREWAAKHNIGPLDVALMENTKFEDLTVRFGYPYLYQHMGYCEHIIVFQDARQVTNGDTLDRNTYPFYSAVQRYYCKLCALCTVNSAIWVVTKCIRLPHRLTYMCGDCFFSYNFENNQKIDDFKAYPFFDRTNFC